MTRCGPSILLWNKQPSLQLSLSIRNVCAMEPCEGFRWKIFGIGLFHIMISSIAPLATYMASVSSDPISKFPFSIEVYFRFNFRVTYAMMKTGCPIYFSYMLDSTPEH